VHEYDATESMGRAPGQGVRGLSPSEAETLLALGNAMNAANLLLLLFGNAKTQIAVFSCTNDA